MMMQAGAACGAGVRFCCAGFCRVDRGIVHVLRMGNVYIVCREIGVQRFVARDEMQDAWFVVSALWFSLGL